MWQSLGLSALLAVGTTLIHMVGLAVLLAFMRSRSNHIRPHLNIWRQGAFFMIVVNGLFLLHAIEILLYAGVYIWLGEFDTMEAALYFSTSTYTTLGIGDIYLDSQWRLVSAIEGFNGFLLIGWSTAFLVTVIGRLRSVELEWLDHIRDGEDSRGS
ncbi:MAG: two pore domain potassium channel family protein [Alphaproteobacteria bacterium]|nr:two pore domain potassium channel family protein [Alphaproteobacteria bacterium]